MYRLLLFSLLILAESKWQKPSNGYKKPTKPDSPDEIIARIVDKLKAADRLVEENCVNAFNITEKYDTDGYILKYRLKHDFENYVKIKIKNSVIYVNVQLEFGVYYNDVRILPSGVETRNAIWWKEQNDLIITIPYKVKRGVDVPLECKAVNDIEVDVELSPEYGVYEFFNTHIHTGVPVLGDEEILNI